MLNAQEQHTIDQAVSILSSLYQRENLHATSPGNVKKFCQLQIGHFEHEVFGVLFLDHKHQLIKFTELFRGTINRASVYPREVAKEVLLCNAAAVIFTHCHPSGQVKPSDSDERLTNQLKEVLKLFDVRVLDHIIVSQIATYSFAENGLL